MESVQSTKTAFEKAAFISVLFSKYAYLLKLPKSEITVEMLWAFDRFVEHFLRASVLQDPCCIAWHCSQVTSSCTTPRVHPSNHHVHLTASEPERMLLKPSNLGSQATVLVRALLPGGNMLSGGRSLEQSYWFAADKDVARASVAQLHRGHRRVRREGLVILVAWSRVGSLEGRALISTNRFLIRASRALHPRTHTHTCSQTRTRTHMYKLLADFPSPRLLKQEIIPPHPTPHLEQRVGSELKKKK